MFGERYQGVGDCFVARDQTVELLLARAVGGQVVAARLRSQSVGARIEIAQARDQRRARGVGSRRQVTSVIDPSVERALLPSEPEQRLNSAEQPAIRGRRGLGHIARRSRYWRSTCAARPAPPPLAGCVQLRQAALKRVDLARQPGHLSCRPIWRSSEIAGSRRRNPNATGRVRSGSARSRADGRVRDGVRPWRSRSRALSCSACRVSCFRLSWVLAARPGNPGSAAVPAFPGAPPTPA